MEITSRLPIEHSNLLTSKSRSDRLGGEKQLGGRYVEACNGEDGVALRVLRGVLLHPVLRVREWRKLRQKDSKASSKANTMLCSPPALSPPIVLHSYKPAAPLMYVGMQSSAQVNAQVMGRCNAIGRLCKHCSDNAVQTTDQ